MASSTKSVPPYATWMYPGVQDSAPSKPRRCIADEIAVCIASLLPCLKPLRVFNGTMPATLECSSVSPGTCVGWILIMIVAFFDAWLRGASQVVVINNPCSGILIIAALFFPYAEVGVHGLLGLTGATAAAFLLKLDQQAITSGLFGYNGLLVGMAFGTFLSREGHWDAAILTTCVLMGGMSTLIQLALGNALVPTFKTPPFTLAFNLTFLLFLLASAHWSRFRMPHHVELEGVPVAVPERLLINATADAPAPAVGMLWLLTSSFISVGQIFLCESTTSGGLILAGMAVSSRIAAMGAFAGALLANALALGLGADEAAIGAGLWGYSSSLTTIAVLTFFSPSRHGCLMACLGVALTVLFDGAMRSAFAPVHMPIGTLPFCFAGLVLMLTHSKIPGFEVIPLTDVSTAEDHLYSVRVGRVTRAHAPIAEVAVVTSTTKPAGHDGDHRGNGSGSLGGGGRGIEYDAETNSPESMMPSGGESFISPFHPMREAVIVGLPASPLSRSRGSSVHGGAGFAPPPGGSRHSSHHGGSGLHVSVGLAGLRASGSSPNLAAEHVAKKLQVMSASPLGGSGHGGRAYELAMRAASGLGLSGHSGSRWLASSPLSREVTAHGGESFETLIEDPQAIRVHVDGDAPGLPPNNAARTPSSAVCKPSGPITHTA